MRWLVTGASGQLGGYLLRHLRNRGEEVVAWSGTARGEVCGVSLQVVDLTDTASMPVPFHDARPEAVIHAAAMARVDECYRDPKRARRVNVDATARLAELAAEAGVRFAYVSTDLVFDGERAPYRETDPPQPLSAYGHTKADGETAALAAPRSVVARVSLLFGPTLTGRPGFFDGLIASLREGGPVTMFADEWRTPLAMPAAAAALVEIARSDFAGIVHVGGPDRLSRLEMGQCIADHLGAS
ncbi:MAG TPA: SDR family oxidoreductase, partial [Gemmataceae bacterium]|nr:SDR family oxidoreductase [Gemmataceae bacterium]